MSRKKNPFSLTPSAIDVLDPGAGLLVGSRDFRLTIPPIARYSPQASPAPAKPAVNVDGYWRGQSGAVLCFRTSGARIQVSGTALDQKVHGEGSIEDGHLKVKLFLQSERIEVALDLEMPTSDVLADYLAGTAAKAGEAERPATFHRLGANPVGTWSEDADSSLTFVEPVLDWLDGEQKVISDARGAIFGRAGEGKIEVSRRHVCGVLKATDWSHHNRYFERRPFAHQESYERDCPKEGWWGADRLLLSLNLAMDGAFMAGRVSPLGRRDDNDIQAHVHLERSVRSASGWQRSLL